MTWTPSTLPGLLAAEIARVTAIRAVYAEVEGGGPAAALMGASLEAALRAADTPDAAAQIAAVRDLQGYTL